MDGNYTSKFDEQAPWRASLYGSSFERQRGLAASRRAGRRRVDPRGWVRFGSGHAANQVRRRAGLELVSVTGGRRHGDGSAALDAAMGTELTRRSR